MKAREILDHPGGMPFHRYLLPTVTETSSERGLITSSGVTRKGPIDLNAKNKQGKTAVKMALEKGFDGILALLTANGERFGAYSVSAHDDRSSLTDRDYAVLNCKKTDIIELIKARYCLLVKQYRPDVIQGKGLPADFVE